jgi:signal transduction histidine kinase
MGFLAAVAGGLLAVLATGHDLPAQLDGEALDRLLGTGTVVVATVMAMLAFVRWRLTGEAAALWLGSGVLMFGLVAVGTGELIADIVPLLGRRSVFDLLRPASQVIALTAVVLAAVGPMIDTRLRPVHLLTSTALAVTLLSVALALVPAAHRGFGTTGGRATLAALWLAAFVIHLVVGTRRRRLIHLRAATLAGGFGLAEIVAAATLASGGALGPGQSLIRLLALAIVLRGTTRELEASFLTQRADLFDTTVAVELAEARRQAENAAHEERVHDARNAILAIEGAAQTLERFRDRLGAEQRATLSNAVSEEIRRLQRLIEAEGPQEDFGVFDLAGLVEPIVMTERIRGSRIDLEIPEGLAVLGRRADTAEVIRNLIENTRRHAPGSVIDLRVERDDTWVVLRVDDRGRGVEREDREAIFERGHRGDATAAVEGSGLGLFVSRRLMRDQGGDLWVEDRQGGGASFTLCLPAAGQPARPDPRGDATIVLDAVEAR